MGDPACFLSAVCMSCGRFTKAAGTSGCPHCGSPIEGSRARSRREPIFEAGRVNTILYCEAFALTVEFYRDLLGLEVTFSNDWFVEFRLAEATTLSIADAQRATIQSVDGMGMTLSVEVAGLSDLRSRLVDAGVEPTPISKRFGSFVFDIHDPEGHRIEFWEG